MSLWFVWNIPKHTHWLSVDQILSIQMLGFWPLTPPQQSVVFTAKLPDHVTPKHICSQVCCPLCLSKPRSIQLLWSTLVGSKRNHQNKHGLFLLPTVFEVSRWLNHWQNYDQVHQNPGSCWKHLLICGCRLKPNWLLGILQEPYQPLP